MSVPHGWKRVTINIEPHLAEIAKKRAKARRQSVASYFASLLESDIAANAGEPHVEEPHAEYGVKVKQDPAILNPSKAPKKKTA